MRRREKNHRLSGNPEYHVWQAMIQRFCVGWSVERALMEKVNKKQGNR